MNGAIVGCGAISRVHANGIKNAGASLTAVCDIAAERAEKLASETGARAYTDFNTMLQNEQLDCLHICTPHYLHVPMAKAALERGINVFLEKPPAMSRAQLDELENAANRSGARISVCFQNRFTRTSRQLAEIIESGKLGKLIGARGTVTWERSGAYFTESGWRGNKETEGGSVLINQAIHTLDLLCFFLGHPTAVQAICANMSHPEINTEDTVCAQIDFEGKKALLYATIGNCCSPPAEVALFFENGHAIATQKECIVHKKDKTEIYNSKVSAVGKECWGDAHAELIRRFYAGQVPCPLSSCRDTMNLLSAIYSNNIIKSERITL